MRFNDRRSASGAHEAKSFEGALLISIEVDRVDTLSDGSVGTETVKYVDRRAGCGERSAEVALAIKGGGGVTGRTVEICRSFSRKLNLEHYGGKSYESADFFTSRKAQAEAGEHEDVSAELFGQCVKEIQESTLWFVNEMRARRAAANAAARGGVFTPPAATARNFEEWRKRSQQGSAEVM